jgi:hypothetical protein
MDSFACQFCFAVVVLPRQEAWHPQLAGNVAHHVFLLRIVAAGADLLGAGLGIQDFGLGGATYRISQARVGVKPTREQGYGCRKVAPTMTTDNAAAVGTRDLLESRGGNTIAWRQRRDVVE